MTINSIPTHGPAGQNQQIDALAGIGLTADLAQAERSAWRRYLPGAQLPWSSVQGFEEEVGRLEERRRAIEAKRLELMESLRLAPQRDRESLAEWERAGRRGPRPEATKPALEAELQEAQESERALLDCIDSVTAERAAYVAKHRDRLVREAHQATAKAHARAEAALNELEAARSALVEARRVETWAALYPDPAAGREPLWSHIGGGLRRVLEPLGVQAAVAYEAVVSALRGDLDWVVDAASPEQRAKLPDARPLTQEESWRERDAQIDRAARVRRDIEAADRRERIDATARLGRRIKK